MNSNLILSRYVTVRLVPNLVSPKGRKEIRLSLVDGKSIFEYISDSGFEVSEFRVALNGRAINIDSSRFTNLHDGDEIVVFTEVNYPVIVAVAWVVNAVIAYAVLHPFLFAYYCLAIGYGVYNYLNARRARSNGVVASGIDENSATYAWDGISTSADIGSPVAVIYGQARVGGNIINQYVNYDGNQSYLNMLLALGEGELTEIGDILINDNPSVNFSGIDITTRTGTNSHTIIPNFSDLYDTRDVGATLTKDDPYVYTSVGLDCEGFQIELAWPQGIFRTDDQGINSWASSFKIEYKLHSSGAYLELGTYTISDKTSSALRRSYQIESLIKGQYDIRITKLSDDNSLDPQQIASLQFTRISEIRLDDLAYPNTALLGIKALASDQLSGSTPNILVDVKGRKVLAPSITLLGAPVDWDDYYYDPTDGKYKLLADDTECDAWDGETFSSQYCANPIWCIRDLLTSTRFGLGEFIDTSNLNLSYLVESSKYCEHKLPDGDEGFEKRFRMDIVLDSNTVAFDALSQLCSTFNGFMIFSGGKISFRIDKAEEPVQLFSMANIKQGSFAQSWKPLKENYNFIEVSYLNAANSYTRESIGYDAGGSDRANTDLVKSMFVFVNKTSYALRLARYAWLVAKYVNRTISFRAGIDSLAIQSGDVIALSHDVPSWGVSGRLVAESTVSSLKLDYPVTLAPATSYVVMVQNPSGSPEEVAVTNAAGSTSTLTLGTNLTFTPLAYSPYTLGTVTSMREKFRVNSMSRANDFEVDIIAIEYNEDVYDDSDISNPVAVPAALLVNPPDVENLTLTEQGEVQTDGSVLRTLLATWTKPELAGYALSAFLGLKIYISLDAGVSWIYVGTSYGTSYSVVSGIIGSTTYRIAVVSFGQYICNSPSSSPYADITTSSNGSSSPVTPPDPTGFVANFSSSLNLTWSVGGVAVGGFEVRTATTGWGTDNSDLIYRGNSNTFTFNPPTRNNVTYYLKSISVTGNYSEGYASVSSSNPAPEAPTNLAHDLFFNIAKLSWNADDDIDIKYYDIYKSETNQWSGEEVLEARVSNNEVVLNGRQPRGGTVDTADSTSITSSELEGFADDYLIGDVILFTKGLNAGEEKTITDFDGTTGEVTVGTSFTVTPDVTSEFIILNQAYYRIKTVDTYGASGYSSTHTIKYEAINADMLGDSIITAKKILVAELSAISANLGTINAGTVTGATLRTASAGSRVNMDEYGIQAFDDDDSQVLNVETTGDNVGDVTIGESGGQHVKYDKSEGVLSVKCNLQAQSGTFEGDVNVGSSSNVVVSGSGEAIRVYGDTVTIDSTNNKMDWVENSTTKVATLASGNYTPSNLAAEVQSKMRAQGSASTNVTYDSATRLITIANSSLSTFTLKFYTGANAGTTCAYSLGFDASSDKSGALTYSSRWHIALRVELGLLM